MSEKTNRSQKSSDDKWYTDRSVQLTVLGVVGTIVAAIITILPQYIGNPQTPEPTQTAIIWTATVVEPPTATQESILPTDTVTPGPTDTATPSPTPTQITPPLSCLDRWQVISSDPDLADGTGQGACTLTSIPGLGISASKNGVSFGTNSFRNQGIFGISTVLPADATVTLTVDLIVLTQGEFWIALSNDPTPENNMAIIALQPQNGEVKTYSDQTSTSTGKYLWSELIANTSLTSGPPYNYVVKFTTSGNRVEPQIHFTNLPTQITNLPKYLFIGYSNKSTLGSVTMQVDVSDLTVEAK